MSSWHGHVIVTRPCNRDTVISSRHDHVSDTIMFIRERNPFKCLSFLQIISLTYVMESIVCSWPVHTAPEVLMMAAVRIPKTGLKVQDFLVSNEPRMSGCERGDRRSPSGATAGLLRQSCSDQAPISRIDLLHVIGYRHQLPELDCAMTILFHRAWFLHSTWHFRFWFC